MNTDPPKNPRKKRRLLFASAALALGLCAALGFGEFILRLWNPVGLRERASWHFLLWEGLRASANPEKVWEHAPGYRRKLVGYSVAINSLGFRSDEFASPKPAGAFRVLALGDSMTFGMSGAQDDCYPAQLQALLRSRHPGRVIDVVNAGILGYTTLQEEALLAEALPAVQPDVVVLWWFHNDVAMTGAANPAPQAAQLRDQIGIKPRTLPRRALHLGYEILPCTMALLRSASVGRGERDRSHFAFDPASKPAGWAANRASLLRIIEACKSRSLPLVVYTFGVYPEIEAICKDRGVPYLTTVKQAGREHEERYAVATVDPHFNRAGNAAVAETILPAVESAMNKD